MNIHATQQHLALQASAWSSNLQPLLANAGFRVRQLKTVNTLRAAEVRCSLRIAGSPETTHVVLRLECWPYLVGTTPWVKYLAQARLERSGVELLSRTSFWEGLQPANELELGQRLAWLAEQDGLETTQFSRTVDEQLQA